MHALFHYFPSNNIVCYNCLDRGFTTVTFQLKTTETISLEVFIDLVAVSNHLAQSSEPIIAVFIHHHACDMMRYVIFSYDKRR